VNQELNDFYQDLICALRSPVFSEGEWKLLEGLPAREGNQSNNSFISFSWAYEKFGKAMVVVNYSDHASQCYIRLPFPELKDQGVRFKDLTSTSMYDRDGRQLLTQGMYFDLPAWGYHILKFPFPPIV
jgi:hypothetical protein